LATPTPSKLPPMTPEHLFATRYQQEIDERNRPLSDEELEMFPEGYRIIMYSLYIYGEVVSDEHQLENDLDNFERNKLDVFSFQC